MSDRLQTIVLEGAWRMESYVRNGETVLLTGVLLLAAGRWSTLYFIAGPETGGHWGSAESGRYRMDGDRLTFHHELTFQGGAGKNLLIDLHSSTVESCPFTLRDETLKIHFPSGNTICCRRYSE